VPKQAAITAIISGVLLNVRAVAAGTINMAAISRTPTTLMATATTIAKEIVNISCSCLGLKPQESAKSELSVDNKRPDHRQAIRPKTIGNPPDK